MYSLIIIFFPYEVRCRPSREQFESCQSINGLSLSRSLGCCRLRRCTYQLWGLKNYTEACVKRPHTRTPPPKSVQLMHFLAEFELIYGIASTWLPLKVTRKANKTIYTTPVSRHGCHINLTIRLTENVR